MDQEDRMQRLRDLVAGGDPTSSNAVVPIYRDRAMLRGSVSPIVHARYESTTSGLFVPVGTVRRPRPLDQAKVYLTAEESLDGSIPLEAVTRTLTRMSLEDVLPWVAHWMARLRMPGAQQDAVDAEFAETYLAEPHRTRVLHLIRAGRVLVVPQALLVLAKTAIVLCHSRGTSTTNDQRPLVFALLGLTEHLGSGSDEDREMTASHVITGAAGPLGREVIANQLANRNRDQASRWATFQQCWRELPTSLAGHPRVIDMVAMYEDATQVPLDDLVAVCAAMWASASSGKPHLDPDYFTAFGWTDARLDAVLRLVSADPIQLAEMHRDEAEEFGVAWSVNTLQQYPVVRWRTGHFTVLDAELLVERATGAWPLYDILRELENRGDNKKADRVRGSYAHIFEHFVTDVIIGLAGGNCPAQRVFLEEDLRKAFGRREKVADLAVDYGHSWLVLDATTSGVQLRTFAGVSDESVKQDIESIVRKAEQIERTIGFLREGQEMLTGYAFQGQRRFVPAVVVAGASPGGPIFMTLLREVLLSRGVLQEPDVASLEILEVEDLHVADAVVERGGPSFIDLLNGKENSGLRDMSLKDYVLLDLGLRPPRASRVQTRWQEWLNTAISAIDGAA